MRNRSKLVIVILVFSSFAAKSQFVIDHLNYRHRIDHSEIYFADRQDVHSGVLPLLISSETMYGRSALQLQTGKYTPSVPDLEKNRNGWAARLYPIADLTAGIEYRASGIGPSYTTGAGLGLDFHSSRFFFTGKLLPYTTSSVYVADSIQRLFHMDLGTTRPAFGNFYTRNELLLAYRMNKFFTFLGGYGKNFFGEGYRSLLLSDNASNYPFLKIETTFGSIKYVNLYTIWNNNTTNPADKSFDRMKFSAMHYLSWNITREFNFSVFESVVWQAKDSINNRGFDASYINPVVFYRPVEYSNGSSDNVLLGANLAYKANKHHCIYTQVIIDEFLLARIKDGSKWWGNKWGWQVGYKSNSFLMDSLYFQTEFNVVRPFTYSHKYAVQNYGHLNASVAHPIGANFYEVLNILSYERNKIRMTNKLTFTGYGADTDTISYGQDIFRSYKDREGDYGHLIMQGLRTNVLNEQLTVEMPLLEKIHLYAFVTYNYRMQYTPAETLHSHYLLLGIRSRIWNAYSDR